MSNTISAVTGLLDLPLEIRRLIYKAIFAEGHAKITVEESTPPGRYETTLKQITQESAILLTCRQTHNEARELFFGNAVLEVTDKVLELVPEKTLKRALSTMKAILVRERTGRVSPQRQGASESVYLPCGYGVPLTIQPRQSKTAAQFKSKTSTDSSTFCSRRVTAV